MYSALYIKNMKKAIIIDTFAALRDLGLVRSEREYARLLGRKPQWVYGLLRRDGGAPRTVRQVAAMRLRMRLLAWRDAVPRPIAHELDALLHRLDEADVRSRDQGTQ